MLPFLLNPKSHFYATNVMIPVNVLKIVENNTEKYVSYSIAEYHSSNAITYLFICVTNVKYNLNLN